MRLLEHNLEKLAHRRSGDSAKELHARAVRKLPCDVVLRGMVQAVVFLLCDGHSREVLACRISCACRFLDCSCVLHFFVPLLHPPVHARSEGLAVSGDELGELLSASSPNPGFVLPPVLVPEDEASWSKKAADAHEHERLRGDGALGGAAGAFTLRDEETLCLPPFTFSCWRDSRDQQGRCH